MKWLSKKDYHCSFKKPEENYQYSRMLLLLFLYLRGSRIFLIPSL